MRVLLMLLAACQTCDVPLLSAQLGTVFPINPTVSLPAPKCVLHKQDAVIVLGCPTLPDGSASPCQIARVDLAVQLQDGPFIVTGGAVANAYVEAEALAELLRQRAVPDERIILEPLARHTDENLYYSSLLMEERRFKTALVVSEDPGHLIYVALCDANCCVQRGRLSVFDHPAGAKVGYYVLEKQPSQQTLADCTYLSQPDAILCLNFAKRQACAADLHL